MINQANTFSQQEVGSNNTAPQKDSLYIVMPTYNEEENIEAVVSKWYPILKSSSSQSRLVIADSGSTDRTHAILQSLQTKYPQLEILSDTNRYHGPKVIALYRYAIDHGATFVFQTDSDDQTNPDEFISFWKDRNNYDGIFGHRKVRGDGQARAYVEKVVCLLLWLFFSVKIPDANAPFRLLRCSTLDKYMSRFRDDYNLPNIMVTAFFVHYKERVTFREVSFRPRCAGVNSINLKRIFLIGMRALSDFAKFKKEM